MADPYEMVKDPKGINKEFDPVFTRRIIDPDLIKSPVGPMVTDFVRNSSTYNGTLMDDIVETILYKETIVRVKGGDSARFYPGCTFGGKVGPGERRKVMIIGKIASYETMEAALSSVNKAKAQAYTCPDIVSSLLGSGRDILLSTFAEAGLTPDDYRDFYVTNIVRFPRIDTGIKKQIPAAWIKECAHYLQQELQLIQPDVILCMGSEPSKVLTGGVTVTKAQGRVFTVPITETHSAKVVCILDPKAVLEKFENRPMLVAGVNLFARVLKGEAITESAKNFYYVDKEEELAAIVDTLIESNINVFSVDCEWGGGQHCLDPKAKLRTIQVAWSGSDAFVAILHRAGMKEAFSPYVSSAASHIRRLLCRPTVRIVGHNFASDFAWLHEYGLDTSGQFYFDTMLASHLFEPTASHDLDSLAVRHLPGWVRHDADLQNWKAEHTDQVTEDTAYGNIPDEILHPYGANDVCATFLVYKYYEAKLNMQQNMGLNALFRDLVMPATLSFIEIERNGVFMDKARLEAMEDAYRDKYDLALERFRSLIGKPYFNPNSAQQKVDLLYNELGLRPVKTTGKYAMAWEEIPEGEEHKYSPAVDDETLGMLAADSPVAKALQGICLIGTVRKSFLTPKVLNEETGAIDYKKGLIGFMKGDGRLHPHISQMVKTGRLAAHDPNLLNMPNQQEGAIQAAAGGGLPSIRSCFMSEPGWLIVAADYMQAEIATLAYLSGDPTLISAVESGEDVHSVAAKEMFKLDCAISEVKKKYKGLRVAAKSIIFGLVYGRGAKAIAREVEKAGVSCSIEDAKGFIDAFFARFPKVKSFIDGVQKQVEEQRFVETLWGRKEYFYNIEGDDGGILARQKRQGVNFLVQSYVADLLRLALINLQRYRRAYGMKYKLILTVHDSIMIEAPISEVPDVALKVLPFCMTEAARAPRIGFKIGSDLAVYQRWDEEMYLEDMLDMGLPDEVAMKFCAKEYENGPPKRRVA